MNVIAARQKASYSVFGHVCLDFSTPTVRLSQERAQATKDRVLGIEGFERGRLMTAEDLFSRHGLKISDVAANNRWNMESLTKSKGGPAASAALGIFQLSQEGKVDFRGAIGNDGIGREIAAYFEEYGMDSSAFIRISGAVTSHTLVVNEQIEGDPEAHRSFLHDRGPNSTVKFGDVAQSLHNLPDAERKVVMVGGNFLMPQLNPWGVMDIFEMARPQGAIRILNTVDDPAKTWALTAKAPELVDVLITDLDEAMGISGTTKDKDENDEAAIGRCMHYFRTHHYRNVAITNGVKGAWMYTTDPFVFSGADGHLFHMPCNPYIASLDQPKYGLGCGDITAGALAVAAGEHMDQFNALRFAMAAGGACALNIAGEITGPCEQGGARELVEEIVNKGHEIRGGQ